jgi:hypothetical protein
VKLPLAPFKVWPQLALVWDPSCAPTGIVNQMGFFSLSLGPLAIEIDGREYVKWMTDVILPEGRMMQEYGGWLVEHDSIVAKDEIGRTTYVHPDTCPCWNKRA